MEYANFSWFDENLNTKEKIRVYNLLGLTNSDIEVGEGKSIIGKLISSNQIESVCKEAGVLWNKDSRLHPYMMKNGVTLYSIIGEGEGGRVATCPSCNECRYYFGTGDGIYRCPECGYSIEPPARNNRSKGEELIEELLIKNNIPFKREVCEFKSYRYDFVAYLNDKKYFLEIHGRQHFEPIEYFGGACYLSKVQKSDKEKEVFAQENGVYIMLDYRDSNLKRLRKDFEESFINKYLK